MNSGTERYKREKDKIIIEVAVKNSRQLFNERDPAPFRERDLDPQFVTYLVSAVEEFPIRNKMKIRVWTAEPDDLKPDNTFAIREAIRNYFLYESQLAKAKLRKRHRTDRFFAAVGLVTLIACLSLAQYIEAIKPLAGIGNVASVSLIIIGWVAMWHPIEALLYDWWPIREQRQYFEKIAGLEVEVSGVGVS